MNPGRWIVLTIQPAKAHGYNPMILQWFNAQKAAEIGISLADQFAPRTKSGLPAQNDGTRTVESGHLLQDLLERADREIRVLDLNFYKKAKFANSFKWRLLENGVETSVADEVTQRLLMHLAGGATTSGSAQVVPTGGNQSAKPKSLLQKANKFLSQGSYVEATSLYQELIAIDPKNPAVRNNLGAALFKQGRIREAEHLFNQAIELNPNFPDAYSNIGNALMLKGLFVEAEGYLRRALKLNPKLLDARVNLALTLTSVGRLQDAKPYLVKMLKSTPRNSDALYGLALLNRAEGKFDEASALINRALEVNPDMPKALAALAGMRKMTSSDDIWLKRAQKVAENELDPVSESELRFSIGKYYDDTGEFKRAFESYKRANDLQKPLMDPYDRAAHKDFVDTMVRVYTREALGRKDSGGSTSERPVFVVGMPRSGTSLVEQIIASHPSAKGAGELMFWIRAANEHSAAIETGSLGEAARNKLALAYLRLLETKSTDALRVVDKTPVNSDFVGVIHAIFPNARFIYMQRDPIDTSLSCFFQRFVLSLNFTADLSDLADYYRQHRRLMMHWRSVLPPASFLDVPYEDLVANQELWTRKILDFIGLEWDERCLEFHKTTREVATASYWQVRQKMNADSVRRWRRYEKFISPLLTLKDLER
jgi:tetratricopeptide (TPR) repeat protein